MKNRAGCIVFFAFLMAVSGCRTNPTDAAESQSLSLSQYPLRFGDVWIYAVTDSSVGITRDTVQVFFSDRIVLPNGREALIQEQLFSTHTDTFFVTVSGDTLRSFSQWDLVTPRTKIVFPLTVDKVWRGEFLNDTTRVESVEPVTVRAGRFNEAFRLRETWNGFNDFGIVKTYIAPGVGIVKMDRRLYLQRQSWELLAFLPGEQ